MEYMQHNEKREASYQAGTYSRKYEKTKNIINRNGTIRKNFLLQSSASLKQNDPNSSVHIQSLNTFTCANCMKT